MNLSGKTILITRSAHQAEEFVRLVERWGGAPIVFPTIEITPPVSWEASDKAIDALYMYDGLMFTSTNGVEFFFRRINERKVLLQDLRSKLIFVVGEKTKTAAESHGLRVTLTPEKFTAQDLAKALQHEDLHGKTFLFPRGNVGDDTLAGNLKILGAKVDSIIVYQTQKPEEKNVREIKTMLLGGKIDVVTFTSPSTFKNFIALFSHNEIDRMSHHTKIAVIGPVTAKAVEQGGLEWDIIPPESTIEALVESIAHALPSEVRDNEIPSRQSEKRNL
ncbi:MAG: uroporphyrinogen-III synthase [Ignavibacteria bacterium]|nr:uroporphyrinogen-III synthase [Ignavibacteria bacterium]MBI3765613.1 uroporphyrinogen-III synthase [Ignavibacteriales bacterium]